MMDLLDFITKLPAGFWTLMVTLAGGAVLKIVEKFLNRDKQARENRDELRTEIDKLLKRVDALEAENDDWRRRYYLNEEEVAILRSFIRGLGHEPPQRQGTNPLYDETKYMLVPVPPEEQPKTASKT